MQRTQTRKVVAVSLSAAVVVGAAILAVKEEQAGRAAPAAPSAVRAGPVDPLVAELARCQRLGESGARDAGCLAAWAESRRRFLAPSARSGALLVRPQVGRPEDER